MNSKFRVIKGIGQIGDVCSIAGILEVYLNPFGEGKNIVEIVHNRNPDMIPIIVKDQTIGNIILEGLP